MMKPMKLLALAVAAALLATLAVAVGAQTPLAPTADGCSWGGGYDPGCDVDHDDDVDIFDIQLTASHWGFTGTWTSNNEHNHLGQVWTGSDNPLLIQGSFDAPSYAPFLLSNDSGNGLRVVSATLNAIQVDGAGLDGVSVATAGGSGMTVAQAGGMGLSIGATGDDGVRVGSAGAFGLRVVSATLNAVQVDDAGLNGVSVAAAGGDGLYVGSTGGSGVWIAEASADGAYVGASGSNGFRVGSAAHNGLWIEEANLFGVRVESALQEGLYVGSAADNGLRVDWAGQDGVHVTDAAGYAGWFSGTIQVSACSGCTQLNFGVNTGSETLRRGDVVAVTGVQASSFDGVNVLLELSLAQDGQGVIGVVQGQARQASYADAVTGRVTRRLLPGSGVCRPGDPVTIVTYGLAQVNVDASQPVQAGQRLTAAGDSGLARPLRTVEVEGVRLAESRATIGIALEDSKEGERLIWMLVNPQ